ncbi:hypothetical protein J1N35_025356, partial [Gossypium stocksii]
NGKHETNLMLRFRGNDCLKWKKLNHQKIKINYDAFRMSELGWAVVAAVARDCTRKVVDG